MRCKICGYSNNDNAHFCLQCGNQFSVSNKDNFAVCPQCSTANKKGASFCVKCGISLAAKPKSKNNLWKKLAIGVASVAVIASSVLIIAAVFNHVKSEKQIASSRQNVIATTNKIEQEQSFKNDLSKDWVYTDTTYSVNKKSITFEIPKLNINSKYADSVNADIEDNCGKLHEITEDSIKANGLAGYEIEYEWHQNDEMLSLVINCRNISNQYDQKYYVYNISLDDGTEIDNTDILNKSMLSLSEAQFLEAAPLVLGKRCELFYLPDSDQNTKLAYDKTISTDNYSVNMPMYLDERTQLHIIADIYLIAGSGQTTNDIPFIIPQEKNNIDRKTAAQYQPDSAQQEDIPVGYINDSDPTHVYPSFYLSDGDVGRMNADEIQFTINQIYAKNGYIFTTDSIQNYFSNMSWYSPKTRDASKLSMSDMDNSNLSLLIKYRDSLANKKIKSNGVGCIWSYYVVDEELSESYIKTLSSYDIQLLINTIYAKNGYIFHTNSIQKIFNDQYWYKGTTSDAGKIKFSSTEQKNLKILVSYR